MTCFSCDICTRELKTGDKFYLKPLKKTVPDSNCIDDNNNNNSSSKISTPPPQSNLIIDSNESDCLSSPLHPDRNSAYRANENELVCIGANSTGTSNRNFYLMCERHFVIDEHLVNGKRRNNIINELDENEVDQDKEAADSNFQHEHVPSLAQVYNKVQECNQNSHRALTENPQYVTNPPPACDDDFAPIIGHPNQTTPSLELDVDLENGGPKPGDHQQLASDHQLRAHNFMPLHRTGSSSSQSQCSIGGGPNTGSSQLMSHSHAHSHSHSHSHAHSHTHSHSHSSTTHCSSSSPKSKRVRTTFTEDQLAILQTHFQSDSNPDGQDLERIATITGLSKRVTQVWFQNSRARQKKYLIKRKPSSGCSTSSGSSTLVLMTTVGSHSSHQQHSHSNPNCSSVNASMQLGDSSMHQQHHNQASDLCQETSMQQQHRSLNRQLNDGHTFEDNTTIGSQHAASCKWSTNSSSTSSPGPLNHNNNNECSGSDDSDVDSNDENFELSASDSEQECCLSDPNQ